VDRICGLFPTTQIGRNTVKNAWVTDEFLLDADVDDARKARTGSRSTVRSFLIRCVNCTASLGRSLDRSKLRAKFVCILCNGLLWDEGISYSDDGRQLTEQYTEVFHGHTYKVVRPCPECRRGWTPPENR
jgi:hypothetical protein